MPIYEYSCKECHQIFEEWTKHIDDAEPQACPVCGNPAERIMSNTSFVLKGGGWYVTDYGYKSNPHRLHRRQVEAAARHRLLNTG